MGTIRVPEGLYHIIKVTLDGALGKDKAVLRERLLEISRGMPLLRNVDDRLVRAAIELLREEGFPICNMEGGDGYFLASNMQEYQDFRTKYGSHAITIFKRVKAMDATVEKKWGSSALQGQLL